MSALTKLQRALARVDLGFPVPSKPGILTHLGTEVGEWLLGGGTAYALGQIHGRYSHKDGVKHIPALTFAVGKVGALIAGAVGGGPNLISGGLSTVGQTGLTAYMLSLGIEHGVKGSNRRLYVLPPGAEVPKGLPAGTRETILGDIPQAAPGRYLNRDQIADLARHL